MTGTLYGIGVGPGDPELLTLKAARILGETPVIAVPVTQPGGDSYALDIVSAMVRPDQQVVKLLFPMLKDPATKAEFRRAAARTVQQHLVEGQDVAFLTEGDPLLHSTFIYVLNDLPPGMQVQVVPGVSSITAGAAQAQLPLVSGDQRLAMIPTAFEDEAALRRIFADFDTVVLLEVPPDDRAAVGPVGRAGADREHSAGRAGISSRTAGSCGTSGRYGGRR